MPGSLSVIFIFCQLIFIHLSDINMEEVVHDAINIFRSIPSSLLYRQFSGSHQTETSSHTEKELVSSCVFN